MKEILEKITYKIDKLETLDNGARYKITINVPMSIGWIDNMAFNILSNDFHNAYQLKHIKNENDYASFETTIELPTKAIYHYYFSFEANKRLIYYKKNNSDNINYLNEENMWKMSVNFETPDWTKGKIMYHIFVDRFNKSKDSKLEPMNNRIVHSSWNEDVIIGPDKFGRWNIDFYGGNLNGIIEKLPYIASLGVTIIYLSPIVLSQSNHRYDTADYEKIDSYVGSDNDLLDLCNKAHELGIKIILDAVFNHTGNDSKYFNEYGNYPELGAYQSKDSKYYPFYRKHIYNNQTYFDYWWGMKNLPVCDGNSKEWQDYIYGVDGIIDKWFKLGIDGLRLDVADELSDEFIKGIRTAVKRNKEDGFILGEVWKNPMHMNREYLSSGLGMDSVMNYPLVNALIRYYKYGDCNTLKNVIKEIVIEYPEDTINSLMNFTSTHDITRAINIFGTNEFNYYGEWSWNLINEDRVWQKNYQMSEEEYQLGKKIYMSYLYTLTFLPGILSIFYGDEIGMQGMGNLANRRPFTWDKIDNELLTLFKNLGKIRKQESFLEKANLELIDVNDKYLVFKRYSNVEEILVMINRTNNKINIILPRDYQNEELLYTFNDSNKQELKEHGAIVLKKKKLKNNK